MKKMGNGIKMKVQLHCHMLDAFNLGKWNRLCRIISIIIKAYSQLCWDQLNELCLVKYNKKKIASTCNL